MKIRLTAFFTEYVESEQASGIILMLCTFTAIVIANSHVGKGFLDFWHLKLGREIGNFQMEYAVEQWVNDGLMAISFL